MIKDLFKGFWKNIVKIFSVKNLVWHCIAIIGTAILVFSGFDWAYYKFFYGTKIYSFAFSAAILGLVIPVVVPIYLLISGKITKNLSRIKVALAIGQAQILGLLLSSFYKGLTGRAYPDFNASVTDITRVFKFGILRDGIFWGWPSSHTTVAFAGAFALWQLFPKNNSVKLISLIYALYIGLGVSMTIHWFSDFYAGAVFGILVGSIVGKSFRD